MTIGKTIQALRKEKGLTQKELAQRLGVSASMIGQYETDVRKPKLKTLEKISAALGVAITDIIDVSEISPSLNSFIPLAYKLQKLFDKRDEDGIIPLTDEDRADITKFAELMSKVPEEISNSSFLLNIMRNEYISLFDKLNFQGKYAAIQAVEALINDPDLSAN